MFVYSNITINIRSPTYPLIHLPRLYTYTPTYSNPGTNGPQHYTISRFCSPAVTPPSPLVLSNSPSHSNQTYQAIKPIKPNLLPVSLLASLSAPCVPFHICSLPYSLIPISYSGSSSIPCHISILMVLLDT